MFGGNLPAGSRIMTWLITKYLVTAGVVVVVSEVAKRSDKLGGLIAALAAERAAP